MGKSSLFPKNKKNIHTTSRFCFGSSPRKGHEGITPHVQVTRGAQPSVNLSILQISLDKNHSFVPDIGKYDLSEVYPYCKSHFQSYSFNYHR